MIGLLHHLERPIGFLNQAARVLCTGGVLAMIEPGMSPVAYPFYRYLHQEAVDMISDPFTSMPAYPRRDPFDANQAIPTLLFSADNRQRLRKLVPRIDRPSRRLTELVRPSAERRFQTLLSGPARLAAGLVGFEDMLPMAVRRFCGFRLFATLEKTE